MKLFELLFVTGCNRVIVDSDQGIIFDDCIESLEDREYEDLLYCKVRSIQPRFDKLSNKSYLNITVC